MTVMELIQLNYQSLEPAYFSSCVPKVIYLTMDTRGNGLEFWKHLYNCHTIMLTQLLHPFYGLFLIQFEQ